MNRVVFLLFLFCVLYGAPALAAKDKEKQEPWMVVHLDDHASVSFPREPQLKEEGFTKIYSLTDSFVVVTARIYDISDELAGKGNLKPRKIPEMVYQTYLERLSHGTYEEVEVRPWSVSGVTGKMVIWQPASTNQAEFYHRIRDLWAYSAITWKSITPFIQLERVLFYNNKLYVFSITYIKPLFHSKRYFERGGPADDDIRAFWRKFCKSIDFE